MATLDLPALRLAAQGLLTPTGNPAGALVHLLAIQGQDYLGAKWSLGLRSTAADADVEQAFARGEIVRTWALRGTLHFVPAADLRWLLALLGPGVIAGNARRYRELELDEATLQRSAALLAAALAGGVSLSRPALFVILEQAGISTRGQRGVHMLQYASLRGLICQGAAIRNQPTFYQIGDSLPEGEPKTEDAGLAELARRYFTTRGPATLPDFIWWSGLSVMRARRALDAVRPWLVEERLQNQTGWRAVFPLPEPESSPQVHLLPGFDEYLLSYKDRAAMMDVSAIGSLTPKYGMPPATITVDGRVVSVWKRTLNKDTVLIQATLFRRLSPAEHSGLERAAVRYGEYLGKTPGVDLESTAVE